MINMMKRSAQKQKSVIALFGLITFICLFIFVPYHLNNRTFLLGWDMRTEYCSYFYNLRYMLRTAAAEHKIPFYSWTTFLGNDYYSTKLFYYQDVFDYGFAFFTDWTYYQVIVIQVFLKFLIAGFSFYQYARYRQYQEKTCILGGLLFAFSAYGMQVQMHPFFASFFVFLPFYFLSVDRYLKEKKKYGFIFWVFFLLFTNYYLFYSVSLFTVFYFLFRYLQMHQNLKGAMKQAFPLIGCYLIGALLCGVVLVPEVLYILSNSRVGKSSSVLAYSSIIPYLDYLLGIVTPTSMLANRSSVIGGLYSYVTANDSVMAVFLWSGSISALLFPQLLKRGKEQKANWTAVLIISVFSLIPFLCSAMHGFSEPSFRWLQAPAFLFLSMCLPFLEDPSICDARLLKITVWVEPAILLAGPLLLAWSTGTEISALWPDYAMLFVSAGFLAAVGFSLLSWKMKLAGLLSVAELCCTAYFSFYGNPFFVGQDPQYVYRVDHSTGMPEEYNQYLLQLDAANSTQFYRTYIDTSTVFWQYSQNLNLNNDIMAFGTYDSTYSSSMDDMKKLADVTTYLNWVFDVKDQAVITLCSGKYALVQDQNGLPEGGHYRKIGDYHGYEVYQNEDYVNLGKTYTKAVPYSDYAAGSSAFTDAVITEDADYQEVQALLGTESVSFEWVRKSMNTLDAAIDTQENGFAVLAIPYDKGWSITVNGEAVKTYRVSGGLIGIALQQGHNEVHMQFVSRGFHAGAVLSGIGLASLIVLIWMDRRHKKPQDSSRDESEDC